MPGVEILASSEVLVSSEFNVASFVFGWLSFLIIGCLAGLITAFITSDIEWILNGTFLAFLPGILFGMVLGCINAEPEEYETHYKVLISDEVSMNEFLEEYEIIDQEGKIYTVKERANKE